PARGGAADPGAALAAGDAALARQHWAEAAERYAEALAHAPTDPEPIYRMAQLLRQADVLALARRYLARYEELRGGPTPLERQMLASLIVKSQGEGGTLYMEGQRIGPLPISLPERVPPARLKLEVRDRTRPARRTVRLEPGGSYRWKLDWDGKPEIWEEVAGEATAVKNGFPVPAREVLAPWIAHPPGLD
ncbi:MAG: hypothetical protein HZA54_11250, partial [Planctomycetes bacterium]|nr:hypothetical protein [Planctomycetota bacterium]